MLENEGLQNEERAYACFFRAYVFRLGVSDDTYDDFIGFLLRARL